MAPAECLGMQVSSVPIRVLLQRVLCLLQLESLLLLHAAHAAQASDLLAAEDSGDSTRVGVRL